MNVVFTCGGTGGHINPAIAVANVWRERYPDSKILFIGGRGNMEEILVPKAGYACVIFTQRQNMTIPVFAPAADGISKIPGPDFYIQFRIK